MGQTTGGGNLTVFYTIPTNGTFTDASTKVFTTEQIVSGAQTGIVIDGTYELNLTQANSGKAFETFIQAYKTSAASGETLEILTYENSVKSDAAAVGDTRLLMVRYNYLDDDGGTEVRSIDVAVVVVQAGSGDYTTGANTVNKRPIIVKCTKAIVDITMVAALFDGTMIDVTDTTLTALRGLKLTFSTGEYGYTRFVATP